MLILMSEKFRGGLASVGEEYLICADKVLA